MILYRKAEISELDKVATICSQAYLNYPLFNILSDEFKSRQQFKNFLYTLQRIYAKGFIKRQLCLVGTIDNEIVSIGMLQKPKQKDISIVEYILNGGLKLLQHIKLTTMVSFLNVVDKTEMACNNVSQENWYLANLVVNEKFQGQHLGSEMLHQCVIPFVRESGGKYITFNTNTEENSRFYKKNQFVEFDKRTINWHNLKLENWSFMMDLQ
ncbi:GNAT family N-acetyltransferase [Ligilactobacillus sp. WILCCON 0076]|uniref:GNAT family N-acetyltransferase n=1 Tax=Ligilactobacillus ubinensis TaxID=2876789 RepID=A0A9X2JMF6_9LACO|nr:GNAT family N-acetyltransferase [Ligilactobacillus ubinensis]MCP0887983.1 GNAT family N-acetyltransferase [Ligilactobacillus ubinensis]